MIEEVFLVQVSSDLSVHHLVQMSSDLGVHHLVQVSSDLSVHHLFTLCLSCLEHCIILHHTQPTLQKASTLLVRCFSNRQLS
jgi:hypothetical protein